MNKQEAVLQLKDLIKDRKSLWMNDKEMGAVYQADIDALEYAVRALEERTAVKHGKWNRTTSDYECSCCQYPMDYITPFCPNCGAKMDLEEEPK